jgi:L-alanine-DL-glutamate epimerase-like enolase superfamily enzyme
MMSEYHGVFGLTYFGISAIDMALWDIVGRTFGLQVYRLLGAHRDRITAFASLAGILTRMTILPRNVGTLWLKVLMQ